MDYPHQYSWASLVAQLVKKSTHDAGELGTIPGLGRFPGGGYGNPLQYSCLENPYGQNDWWNRALGISKSQTQLSD